MAALWTVVMRRRQNCVFSYCFGAASINAGGERNIMIKNHSNQDQTFDDDGLVSSSVLDNALGCVGGCRWAAGYGEGMRGNA